MDARFLAGVVAVGFAGCLTAAAWQGPVPPQGSGPPPGPGQGQRGGARGGGGQGRGQGPGPARDAANQVAATGTGSITGNVTLEGGGTPVRRAQVTLSGTDLRGVRSATTNDQGRFAFLTLPPGRFNLSVSKAGYVTIAYGAKKPGRQGTPIQLADGQKLENANISLPRGSVITGIVIDENAEASPNTQVRAYRYVLRNGEKSLQQVGQDQTDDRGMYRIFQLLPGDYLVSAMPRNQAMGDVRQTIQSQLEPLLQQLQAAGGGAAGAGQGRAALNNVLGGGGGQALLDRVQQLQQQLQQQPEEQAVAYAPVYYPGTPTPSAAAKVVLGVGEEHGGIDFQLQLVPTAKVQGVVVNADGTAPSAAQISLQPAGVQDVPSVPGVGMNVTRVNQDGKFSFQSVTPGQYTLMVRAALRQPVTNATGDTAAGAAVQGGGRGGRGGAGFFGPGGRGGGAVAQVLWASADVTVDGRDVSDITLSLQPGMTVSGRIAFDATTSQQPADLTTVRVNLQPAGQTTQEIGPAPSGQVDANGQFTLTGVAPGRYSLRANVAGAGRGGQGLAAQLGAGGARGAAQGQGGGQAGAGGQSGAGAWTLKTVVVNGRDTLDFALDIKPNENISGALITFSDRAQEVSGTLQDAMGRPTADYTVILYAADNRYWTPQSRRIVATRPGTDGKFSFRNLPAGQYRLTAVTDAEPGEWFDPAFLSQLVGASMTLTLNEGEKKVQDIRLAGG